MDHNDGQRIEEPIRINPDDGKFDRDGQRIENPIPGNPGGLSVSEREAMESAGAYAFAQAAGTLGQWYAYHDPARMPDEYLFNGGRERERD